MIRIHNAKEDEKVTKEPNEYAMGWAAMSVTVIWALTVHGRDIAVAGERAQRARG